MKIWDSVYIFQVLFFNVTSQKCGFTFDIFSSTVNRLFTMNVCEYLKIWGKLELNRSHSLTDKLSDLFRFVLVDPRSRPRLGNFSLFLSFSRFLGVPFSIRDLASGRQFYLARARWPFNISRFPNCSPCIFVRRDVSAVHCARALASVRKWRKRVITLMWFLTRPWKS